MAVMNFAKRAKGKPASKATQENLDKSISSARPVAATTQGDLGNAGKLDIPKSHTSSGVSSNDKKRTESPVIKKRVSLRQSIPIELPLTREQRKALPMSTKIVESCWCYGCRLFSVDNPFTERETMWCMREEKDGSATFKPIRQVIEVRQCPNRKELLKG